MRPEPVIPKAQYPLVWWLSVMRRRWGPELETLVLEMLAEKRIDGKGAYEEVRLLMGRLERWEKDLGRRPPIAGLLHVAKCQIMKEPLLEPPPSGAGLCARQMAKKGKTDGG